ncbi:MAG: PAS domain-containing protein [Bryobacteraceae bacterium]
MEAERQDAGEEAARLRRCLNDLVSIMALPALWAGGEPQQIAGTLLDALAGMLQLTFAFVRLNDPDGGPSIEMARVAEPVAGMARQREIADVLDASLGDAALGWPRSAQLSIGNAVVYVACAGLGFYGELGVVVAGSQANDFPDQMERLLLDVATNQAAIGLQQARLLSEQKRVSLELDQRVAQRTRELAAANDELRRSESESRLIVNSIPGLVTLLTATGAVAVVNRQVFEYFGQSLEEIRQWETNGTVHPDDLPHVTDAFTRSIASGTPYEIVQRFRRSDGVYRWFQSNGSPIRDAHGRVVSWCVLLTDIDDRKRAEDELRRSEGFLAEGQNLAKLGSFSWRVEDGRITWSDQLYRIFDFEPGSLVTVERLSGRVHPDDIQLLNHMIERARSHASNFEYEHRLLMPDKSVKHLHLIAHATRDDDGRLEYLGAVQDVTERRLSEEALSQARTDLARVAGITSLGVLTASIAHEVNQPLSGIVTNASTCLRMLAADPPNLDGARETARRTIRDGHRASEVITRLRALFSGRGATLETLDLNDATREVIALSLSELQRSRVVLQTEYCDSLPPVSGNRVQLQQVILNLIQNALDAMSSIDDRPRHLLVRTEPDAADCVRLTVRDSGVGFAPETAIKLFEAFYTTKNDGMGIGLSVSRSIIENHRGRLWATTNDGPGVAFSFSVPRRPQGGTSAV